MTGQDAPPPPPEPEVTKPTEDSHSEHGQDDSRSRNLNELCPEIQANIVKHVSPLYILQCTQRVV